MHKIFIDTWGWLSLADEKEKRHHDVLATLERALREKTQLFTSDAVFSETITLLFRRLPEEKALQVLDIMVGQQHLQKISITPERFQKGLDLRKQYADHPDISFTDILSFAIMDEYGISQVVTEDHHFEIVDFGFQRLPG